MKNFHAVLQYSYELMGTLTKTFSSIVDLEEANKLLNHLITKIESLYKGDNNVRYGIKYFIG